MNGHRFVIVPMNCYGSFGNGFAYRMNYRYPFISMHDAQTNYADRRKLGTYKVASMKGEPTFIIAYVTFGYNFRPDIQKDYLDYDALARCLRGINENFQGAVIACPYIGCNRFDGNGDKDRVLEIMKECTSNIILRVYDYYQQSVSERDLENYKLFCYMHATNRMMANHMREVRKRLRSWHAWRVKDCTGYFNWKLKKIRLEYEEGKSQKSEE